MDPYLERYWLSVHHRLITYSCDLLAERLPTDLRARIEERVLVESEPGLARLIYPDVHVVEPAPRGGGGQGAATAVATVACAEPLVIEELTSEPMTQGYIEVIDAASGGRVATTIEYLSPSNKAPGPGRELYLKKQAERAQAGVSLVEIDLTHEGQRVLRVPPARVPESHRTTYQVCVSRATRRHAFEVYRVPLRERLPVIRVPLRATDADLPLDLQALLNQTYAKGRYDSIDYRQEPVPPLDTADAAWADVILREASLR